MKLKKYERLCITIDFVSKNVILASGDEYGTGWDQSLWGDGSAS